MNEEDSNHSLLALRNFLTLILSDRQMAVYFKVGRSFGRPSIIWPAKILAAGLNAIVAFRLGGLARGQKKFLVLAIDLVGF
ncbi:hypothetical protein BpHYR1_041713 [Brachionus plicatilis]|uniref:Uncharacterized protein n=1 Tax=Brachionus plicatilis TaxID=10195 RepID=A0A3M7PXJ7_BRAPC|nr:hypothetical protein BpHYR1_041713 [Brachionus plicatilis]